MKMIDYTISADNLYITCGDVPVSVCSDMMCSECPFNDKDVVLSDLIAIYVEVHNAGN